MPELVRRRSADPGRVGGPVQLAAKRVRGDSPALVGEQEISTLVLQLSVAVGSGNVTYAPAGAALHCTLVAVTSSKGQVICGGV